MVVTPTRSASRRLEPTKCAVVPRPERLRAVGGLEVGAGVAKVDVSVDEARHEGAASEVDDGRTLRHRV